MTRLIEIMPKDFRLLSVTLYILMLFYSSMVSAEPLLETIPLRDSAFEHIQFKKIGASHFEFEHQELRISVNESASFLMMPFDEIKKISEVRFRWKTQGEIHVRDAAHENLRNGDDAVFKLGLLLKTDDVLFNPFVPSWLKRVQAALRFPSKDMIYLVADARHEAGEDWVSPYNERVTMVSVKSLSEKEGWWQASHYFERPVEVVALWLMADGDDTGSSFVTQVKDIELWR